MPSQLPLIPSEFNYRFSMDLLGDEYIFDVRWNARDSAWYLSLYDVDENPIALGMRVVVGATLGAKFVAKGFPAGVIAVSDLSASGVEADFDDLGTRVVAHFYSFEELEL